MFGYDLSNPDNHRIGDPVSVWHFKKCNFSYADGHADAYRWKNQNTHEGFVMIAEGQKEKGRELVGNSGENEDIRFLARGYRAK